MSDIFENARDQRFIVAPQILTDNELLIILTDIKFWNDNFDQLQYWCKNNNSQQQGMTVLVPDSQSLTAFCLRWS